MDLRKYHHLQTFTSRVGKLVLFSIRHLFNGIQMGMFGQPRVCASEGVSLRVIIAVVSSWSESFNLVIWNSASSATSCAHSAGAQAGLQSQASLVLTGKLQPPSSFYMIQVNTGELADERSTTANVSPTRLQEEKQIPPLSAVAAFGRRNKPCMCSEKCACETGHRHRPRR